MSGRSHERRAAHHFNYISRGEAHPSERRGFVDGEVVEDRSMVAELCSILAMHGAPLACSRCGAADEPIVAIVIIESLQSAWLACGECWRKLPRARRVD